jgi:hypothetical protein
MQTANLDELRVLAAILADWVDPAPGVPAVTFSVATYEVITGPTAMWTCAYCSTSGMPVR